MSELLLRFQEKVDEINKYFEFVQFLDIYGLENSRILKTKSRPDFKIDSNLEKVLKGNCYLMLYNLVEGSLVESINAIFVDINQNAIPFVQLTPAYKQIWLKYKYHLVQSKPKKSNDKHTNMDTDLEKTIQELDLFTINTFKEKKYSPTKIKEYESFDDYKAYLKVIKVSDISGNLDARIIRDDLSRIYDFEVPMRCDELLDVKNARNKLAHGEETFSDAGKRNTIQELTQMKVEVIKYLKIQNSKL